jgi:type IV secretion system protein VirB1
VKVEHHPQLASPAQARIVAQSNGPVYVPSEDPHAPMSFTRPPVRWRGQPAEHRRPGGVAVVLGSVDRMMQPQAQGGGAYPQQQAAACRSSCQQGAAQAMAMPQQLPGGCAGARGR